MALEEVITPEFNVLEFGAGGSTIFFSHRCKSVKTYEWSPEWVDKVKEHLPNPSNVILICKGIMDTLESLKDEPKDYFDVILVDNGPDYRCRLRVLNVIPSYLKAGGYLVVDNYSQRHIKNFSVQDWWVYIFDDIQYHGSGTKIFRRPPL